MTKKVDKDVLDQQRHVTENITQLCRYIAFGIAATCYSVITSDSAFSKSLVLQHKQALITSTIIASFAIVFDYFQFLCGYGAVRHAVGNDVDGYAYDPDTFCYKARRVFFWLKQVALALSVISFVYVLAVAL